MSDEVIAVDLTATSPVVLTGDGAVRRVHPSFCLPWFNGEPPLAGDAASWHRRGSALIGPGDVPLAVGAARSRRHFSEAWSQLCSAEDDLDRPDSVFAWKPDGTRVSTTFERVLDVVLGTYAGVDAFLSMVVPDALGVGGQQLLLDTLSPRFGRVQLVPRTTAIAMAWCASADTAQWSEPTSGEAPNFLVVASANADRWELSYSRVLKKSTGEWSGLCPVRDTTKSTTSLQMTGSAWEVARRVHHGVAPDLAWLEVLLCEDSAGSSEVPPGEEAWGTTSKWLEQNSFPDACDGNCLPSEPLRLLRRQGMPPGVTPRAFVVAGSDTTGRAPGPLYEVGASWLSTPVVRDTTMAVYGAAEVARRIDMGLASYFETLVPLELFAKKTNQYGDPVPGWQRLIEQAEVEAGSEYMTKDPIQGLSLPANEKHIELCLRRRYRGQESLRNVSTRIQSVSQEWEPLTVSARIRPGQGFARVEIKSTRDGIFESNLNWRTMKRTDETPRIEYGWPPGVAKVVETPVLCDQAESAMLGYIEAFQELARGGDVDLNAELAEVRNTLNLWLTKTTLERRHDVIPEPDPSDTADHNFIYYGPISSHHRVDDTSLGDTLARFNRHLLSLRNQADFQKVVQCASWLYLACPREIVGAVKDRFIQGVPGKPELSLAGNVFSSKGDLKVFYTAFCKAIRQRKPPAPNEWLRAYRNIARFRPDGVHPDVLTNEDQDTIARFVYSTLDQEFTQQNYKTKFNNCLYVLPHMMKRRRYDQRFLNLDVGLGPEFRALLEQIHERHVGRGAIQLTLKQVKLAQGILELLDFRATETTIQLVEEAE